VIYPFWEGKNMFSFIKTGLLSACAFIAFGAFACPCPPEPGENIANFSISKPPTIITKPGSSQPTGEILELAPKQAAKGTAKIQPSEVEQLRIGLTGRYANRGVAVRITCQDTGRGTVQCTVLYPEK
jgi:hypothetical protein